MKKYGFIHIFLYCIPGVVFSIWVMRYLYIPTLSWYESIRLFLPTGIILSVILTLASKFAMGVACEDVEIKEQHEKVVAQREKEELVKLREFFKEICDLTVNHDSISYSDGEKDHDYAVVFPNKLEESLIRVNPEWWKND